MTAVARLDPIARVAQRLSVLLAAGVSPASAWGYLDAATHPPVDTSDIVGSLTAAEGLPVERLAWRGIAAAWSVATAAGAPLAPSLAQFAAGLRSLADAQRETEVALAGPVATSRMVMALPAVGLIFGMLLGFNTLGTLLTTGPGIACLVLGSALLLAGARWNRRLVASAQPTDPVPGLQLELLAIAVSGGGSLERAVALVETALTACSLPPSEAGASVLELSQRAGVPARALLIAEADDARREARAAAQAAAAVLAVRLMLPLGLCVLPAFMLLTVAPMVIAIVTSTVAGF